eukprot:UN14514
MEMMKLESKVAYLSNFQKALNLTMILVNMTVMSQTSQEYKIRQIWHKYFETKLLN